MGILADKVIIVTGATSGIGEATAKEAAKEGAKVVLAARREEKGNQIVDEIKKNGGTAIFVRTDVSKESDVKNLVDITVKEFGKLDGAYNNAGYLGAMGNTEVIDIDEIKKMADTNYYAMLYCMKYEIEQMKKQGTGGSIVNCSSIVGIMGFPGMGPYVGFKHAIIGSTKNAALETAQYNIRVNAILPGPIETEIFNPIDGGDQILAGLGNLVAMKRTGKPSEIAKPVCFLLSDGSTFMTGSEILADGGFIAGAVM